MAQAGADQDAPEERREVGEGLLWPLQGFSSAGSFLQIRFGLCSPHPWGGEADPAGCENGKQLKALTIKSSSVFGEEVVRAALLLKAGFTRTVLFPALCNSTLPIILLLPLCFPCTHFKCCYKMDGEGCGRIPVWK